MYTQRVKEEARVKVLKYAVELLTSKRGDAPCISNSYVRNLAEHIKSSDYDYINDSNIDYHHVCSWEDFHRSHVGNKSPKDLTVCYLSGPEPNNDFSELIKLGIHPHNIWAFEKDKKIFEQAVLNVATNQFNIPKLTNRSIEGFFEGTPKQFDIIYIDGCGVAFPSKQRTFRILATLLKHNRLKSPGIIISNFAKPTSLGTSEINFVHDYLINREINNNFKMSSEDFKKKIVKDYSYYYGEYITQSLFDLSSVVIPSLRFVNSDYWNILTDTKPNNDYDTLQRNCNYTYGDTGLLQNMLTQKHLQPHIFNDFMGKNAYKIPVPDSLSYIHRLKRGNIKLKSNINNLINNINDNNLLFSYVDRTNSDLILDLAINQLAYPMHYNASAHRRYRYTAKETEMFMDVLVLDSCRYVYEWMPTIHLLDKALQNPSWQNTFRYALHGLIMNRINYNNEFFYRASVLSRKDAMFGEQKIIERTVI